MLFHAITGAIRCQNEHELGSLQRRRRPHIFGMTASPLDTKLGKVTRDPGSFIGELEAALDSKVSSRASVNTWSLNKVGRSSY